MELNDSFFSDEELEEQRDKDGQAMASKKWLSSTFASLTQLDQVKPNVYNVGLLDLSELKGSNLSTTSKRSHSFTDLSADAQLSTLANQRTAWGSNGSIPDMVKHSGQSEGRPHRPESAKTASRRYRPPSGRKTRPESAKENKLPPKPPPKISVKGAKCDTADRPAKQTPHQSVTTGWVGHSAGTKTPDSQTDQVQTHDLFCIPRTPPPAPQGTPVSRLDIDVEMPNINGEESDEEGLVKLKYTKTKGNCPSQPRPTPEPLHINLAIPTMDDEEEQDSDLDTDRLLEKAERYSTNKHYEEDQSIYEVSAANQSGDYGNTQEDYGQVMLSDDDEDSFSFHSRIESSSESDGVWSEDEQPARVKPAEKNTVKFSEERNVTIDITPRNTGHKVGSHSPKGQHKSQGQRSAGRNEVSEDDQKNLKAALSVKSVAQKPVADFLDYSVTKPINEVPLVSVIRKGQRPSSAVINPTTQERSKVKERPRSAVVSASKPVGKSLGKPVTQVIVDYGETEKEVKRKSKHLRNKDIVTMVQDVSISDEEMSSDSESDIEITPDLLRPGSPIKCMSEPTKNYYEISRQSTFGRSSAVDKMFDKLKESTSGKSVTMAAESGEDCQESEVVKSVLDSKLLRIGEKQMVPHQMDVNREKAKAIRPPSAKKPPVAPTGQPTDEERPGSRLGFVAMAPEKVPDKQSGKKVHRRPTSAQSKRAAMPSGGSKKKQSSSVTETETVDTASPQQEEDPPTTEVKGLTERQILIQSLMDKHINRPRSAISHKLNSPKSPRVKSPKSPKYASPKSSARSESKISSAWSDLKATSPKSNLKVTSPKSEFKVTFPKSELKATSPGSELKVTSLKSQKEKAIDDMIEKHLKRPPSVFTPEAESESGGESSLSPPSSPRPVTMETASPSQPTIPTNVTKSRIYSAPSLPSPKSTLISELSATERIDKGDKCGCKHGRAISAQTKGMAKPSHSHYTRAKSAPVKRPATSKGPRIHYRKPVYINTVNHDDYPETKESQECTLMQAKLAAKGFTVSAKTLQRALYPPSGQTMHYEITATLPKSQSLGLLSHPKVWLPDEYRELKSAERDLDKVNEMLYMQKKAEDRKAKAADGKISTDKKKKKKGKKRPTSSLKRSKSFT